LDEQFLVFQMTVVLSSSGVKHAKKKIFSIKQSKIILLGLLNPEGNGNTVLQNFRGCQVTLHYIPKELYVHQYCRQNFNP